MTCRECRDELDLMIGQADLPQEIREHLATCAECRAWWDELSALVTLVADDSQFHLSASESTRVMSGIDRRLNAAQSTFITPMNWLRYAALAATIIIVTGIGITGYRANWFGQPSAGIDTTMVAQVDTQSARVASDDSGYGLDDDDYSILERAIDSTSQFDNAAALDSLNDEQIQYLESHLDVRGLI